MRQVAYGLSVISALLLAPIVSAAGLADIQASGSLRIGISMFEPWTFENEDGELEGFEIDVGRRVAQAMGVEPEFKVYVWDDIIDGLQRDEIFAEPRDAEAAVLSGRAHGYLTSVPEATVLVSKFPDRLRIPLAEALAGAPAGFAVRPGNDTLLEFLNEWIHGTEEQEWLDKRHHDWFGY